MLCIHIVPEQGDGLLRFAATFLLAIEEGLELVQLTIPVVFGSALVGDAR